MLKTVRDFFDILGFAPEDIKFKKEEFNSENLIEAVNNHKCPAVITIDLLAKPIIPKVMVATGFESRTDVVANLRIHLIKCKNSYLNDDDIILIPVKQFSMRDFNQHSRRFPHSVCAFYIAVEIDD